MHVAPYSMEDDDPQKYFISGEAGIASDRAGIRADKQAPLIALLGSASSPKQGSSWQLQHHLGSSFKGEDRPTYAHICPLPCLGTLS